MNPIHILHYLRLRNAAPEAATLDNSLEVADWFYSGHLGELPANEQRIYDAYKYLRTNFVCYFTRENYVSLNNEHVSLAVNSVCDSFINEPVEATKGATQAKAVLPKPVKRELIKCIKEAVDEKKQADLDKNWPLPTVWDKPKKTKKGKK
jgi:hypothetical protein